MAMTKFERKKRLDNNSVSDANDREIVQLKLPSVSIM